MELRHEHRKQAISHRPGPHRVLCRLAEASPRTERVAAARSFRFRPDRQRSQDRSWWPRGFGPSRSPCCRRTTEDAGAARHQRRTAWTSATAVAARHGTRLLALPTQGTMRSRSRRWYRCRNYHGYCGNAATMESLDRAEVTPRW